MDDVNAWHSILFGGCLNRGHRSDSGHWDPCLLGSYRPSVARVSWTRSPGRRLAGFLQPGDDW